MWSRMSDFYKDGKVMITIPEVLFYYRKNTSSLKWDDAERRFGGRDILPLWVADMDFPSPPAVIESLRGRVEHGVFGYTVLPDSCLEAITGWLAARHGWRVDRMKKKS